MDIAELGYKIDSSGLVDGTKALDENAAAAERAGGAADRLDREYQALARTVERSSSSLGDRLGGALDRIGSGTGAVVTELQTLNRTNIEILASLGALGGKFASTAGQAKAFGAAGAAAAASAAQVTTASQQLEQKLAQQEARYKAVAQQALAWSQGNQAANLSERALAEAAREAAAGIDYKARAMAGAGSEQDRMAARARSLQEAEARAANETRQAAAAVEAQKINLQQLLGQIDPTIGALNRLAAIEDRLERAHKAGLVNPAVFDQYQTKIDAMRASVLNATGAQNGMGMSARQLQNNLRMIPSQMTDITTSILAGQPAWMVAIQQGGQLKDQFGGIGPAARAVGGYIVGLINPITVLAAVIGALVLAWKQGSDAQFEFQRNLLLTGRTADVSYGQLNRMIEELDRLPGVTRGGALTALNEVAKASEITGAQFALVSQSAARMEASLGQSADRTVAAFQRIAKDPLDALLDLNRAEGFLTQSQAARIAMLQQEGREQQAVAEAVQIYHDHLNGIADLADSRMPAMTEGWRSMKDEISGTWGAVVNVTNALADMARVQIDPDSLIARVLFAQPRMLHSAVGTLRDQVNSIAAQARNPYGLPTPMDETGGAERREGSEPKAGPGVLDPRLAQRATEQWNRRLEMYDKELKLGAEIERIEAEGIAAGRSRAEIEATIANYKEKQAEIERRKNRLRSNGDDSAAQNMLAAAHRQIEANKQLADTGIKVTESERQAMAIEQVLAKSKNTMTASSRAQLEAARAELVTSGQKAAAYTREKEAAEALARQQAILAQASSNRGRSNELDLMGMGRGADAVGMLRRQLDIQREYQDELKRIGSRDVASDKASWDLLAANAAAYRDGELAKERLFQGQRLALLGDWRAGVRRAWEDYVFDAGNALEQANGAMTNALSGWEDAWVRFAQTGKLSFSDLADSIISDLARIAAKQMATGLFGNMMAGWMGGGVTTTGNSLVSGGTQSINAGLSRGLSFGGGRATGGGVDGRSFYEVGEGGRPELFQQNGRTYLIPGNSGMVIPAAPTSGGTAGGGAPSKVNVTIKNAPPGTTGEASVSQGQGGALNIEVMMKQVKAGVADDISNGGPILSAIKGRLDVQERV
ncbi:phage tail length tape measure family protein [Stenotrophomonas sp.]|uniref:phage tail length tape measure family protein n=1 Tax=Stenotrophomonas sp. TaxID=69392 RepID=UPI0028A7790C|nr:phage tail length tape measure family protein [Stenotrophomonas sp.]